MCVLWIEHAQQRPREGHVSQTSEDIHRIRPTMQAEQFIGTFQL